VTRPTVLAFGVAATALLGGCRVGPGYARPHVEVPPAYRDQTPPTTGASIADVPWWQAFGDPTLVRLLGEALANNQDLALAVARVAEARATAGVVRADLFPQVEGTFDARRTRSSRELGFEFGPRTDDNFRAAIGASWELDLWGRVRRSHEAALADWLASEAGRRAVVVTLLGDVAEAYFDLRELDLELEITQATLATRRKTSDLFAKRLEGGVSSNLETSQAEADLAAAAALVPDLERRIAQQENRIALLLGRAPGPVARGPGIGALAVPPDVPAGLPATLLERRPDVQEAELGVRAAVARIGAAQAAYFPRVSLTALLGLESNDLENLTKDTARIGSLGAGLVAPIFQGGRLRAEHCVAVAQWEQAVAVYRRAVQDALRDVADQLVAIEKLREVRSQLETVVVSLRRALSLSTTRYENGISAYFEVLDAQRRLFPAEIEAARTQRDQHVAFVRLYRALGGGACP
jgi:multidrug efflux system outer membrane protein